MIRRAVVVLIAALVAVIGTLPVRAQEEGLALILSPVAGQTLIGSVTVTGTAASPNFQRYKLEFALQGTGETRWFPIAEVAQQVTGGPLAQWDTAAVPDGVYQLRLRVTLRNGAVLQTSVQNLIVNNRQATALPTVPPPPTGAATEVPTLGPTAAPLVQQPPISTLRPTFAPIAVPTAPPAPNEVTQLARSAAATLSAVQAAFCSGAWVAVIGFGVFGLYQLLFSRVGRRFRQWLNSLRGE
jgi:hypothetical protein